jgi:hypothetical protein
LKICGRDWCPLTLQIVRILYLAHLVAMVLVAGSVGMLTCSCCGVLIAGKGHLRLPLHGACGRPPHHLAPDPVEMTRLGIEHVTVLIAASIRSIEQVDAAGMNALEAAIRRWSSPGYALPLLASGTDKDVVSLH